MLHQPAADYQPGCCFSPHAVLAGTLLKYYSSERDVGIEHPRGVLELQVGGSCRLLLAVVGNLRLTSLPP